MTPEGHCPACDNDLLAPDPELLAGSDDSDTDGEKVPWHFKLMVVLLVAYLGWRFWQLAAGLF